MKMKPGPKRGPKSWRHTLNPNLNKAPVGAPPKPDDLTPEEAAKWDEISGLLVASGLLTQLDGPGLRAGVEAKCELDAMQRAISREGLIVKRPVMGRAKSGEPVHLYDESIPHPLLKNRNAAARRLLTFLNDYGMTPLARLRAGMPITAPPVEDDPAARILDC